MDKQEKKHNELPKDKRETQSDKENKKEKDKEVRYYKNIFCE
ncbi:hypothetical protein [Pseudalkalibacillus caeni]|nr:hypothetical protein [Pseudalkalibacillus caeni]